MEETKLTDERPAEVTSTEPDATTDAAETAMRNDIALLRELFPTLSANDIPDEVWKKVSEGEGLAASYALYFLCDLKKKEKIAQKNRENEEKALGKIKHDHGAEDYFSAETVRAMSPAEVRKHYAAILKSMDSWN